MEQESSGKRSQNQLQGSALQDETVQHRPARSSLDTIAVDHGSASAERVVIQYGDRTVKGITEMDGPDSVEQFLRRPQSALHSIRLRLIDSDTVEDLPLENAKAVFLVKTFDGNDRHNPLHFHTNAAVTPGLWVRIEFNDEEVMEGIVHNTGAYVLGPGFLLIPTDPGGNNRMAYVFKKSLKNFEVLGMRNPPKGHSTF